MRIESIFHTFVFFMAVLTFSAPFIAIAQEIQLGPGTTENQSVEVLLVNPVIKIQAEQDAAADTSKLLWFGGNFLASFLGTCVLGSVGMVIAYVLEPTPPASRLLGKSPGYVVLYSQSYRAKARNVQLQSAAWGCVTGTIVSVSAAILVTLAESE